MAEGTASSAAGQLRNYGVGFILGLAAVGYIQAATTLMGPFMVIYFGMGLVVLPEAARILRSSPPSEQVRTACESWPYSTGQTRWQRTVRRCGATPKP